MAAKAQRSGNLSDAAVFMQKALAIDPDNADYLHFFGLIRHQTKNSTDAISLISRAIVSKPNKAIFHYNLGVLLKDTHQFERALLAQHSALKLSPNNTHYLNEIALIYIALDNLLPARNMLQQSLKIDPSDATTHSNFSYLLRQENKPEDAMRFAQSALSLNPRLSSAYMNLGQALVMVNQLAEGMRQIQISFEFGKNHLLASQQSLLLNSLYLSENDPVELFEQHRQFCQQYLPSKKTAKPALMKDRLSIAFVSSDFRFHSVFHFFRALARHYDNNTFQFYCYSGVSQPDAETQSLKHHVDHWRDIYGKKTHEIVQQIETDNIDILIDLSGHSKGNFLSVFSERPAPIQMTFLGYPFSTGLEAIDYKITDELADPAGMTEAFHSEKLLKLNPSFLCYSPCSSIEIAPRIPAENNGYVTFASFNKFSKLSRETLALWSTILHRVENAKLILKNNQPLSALLRHNILSVFIGHGIASERIVLMNPTTTTNAHLHQYNTVDICLDPFPYNGTTTTFEALWMGVPVISLVGNNHRSRVGNSILRTLGHETLLSKTKTAYVNTAMDLANNLSQIIRYRKTLREDLKASVLTDGENYTREFERLMQDVWKEKIAKD